MYVQKIPWEVNYDESQMPQYTLPDVLLCQDGSKVETAEAWQKKRRPELLQMFKDVMYGEIPPRPDRVRYELLSEKKDARGGKAVRREVRIHLEMNNGKSHSIDMLYYLPANAKGKVPVFVGLTFIGNHVVTDEPDVRITGLAGDTPGNPINRERGFQVRRFPIDTILERGYALAVASYHDIFPDRVTGWETSIYELFFSGEELKRPKGYSCVGAWAWGISRMLDYLETVPEIDASKAAVYGHSRLGKTSLWAGVTDERFKLVCVNDSGCGGAALSRRLYGETLFSMCNFHNIGKYWFTDTLADKAEQIEKLNAVLAEKDKQIEELNAQLAEQVTLSEKAAKEVTELNEKTQENTAFVEELGQFATEAMSGVPANALDALDDSDAYMIIRKITVHKGDQPMLHAAPNMHSDIIGHAVEPGQYIVLEVSGNSWYKIQVRRGKIGWIFGGKVTLEEIRFVPGSAAEDGE